MSNRLADILDICAYFAQPCFLCGARSRAGLLCPSCAADLPVLADTRCPRCALPTPGGEVCGACLKSPPAFDLAAAAYRYDFPVDVLMQQFKYAGQTVLSGFLAESLLARLPDAETPDLVLPMPLHPRRLRERGFNQAALLARHLANRLGVDFDAGACRRKRDTPAQVGLPDKVRRKNLRDAFVCERALTGLRVALVDDVMTTGASLGELATAVKRAGAVSVQAWVVARTV